MTSMAKMMLMAMVMRETPFFPDYG